jgi:hypothetical protein
VNQIGKLTCHFCIEKLFHPTMSASNQEQAISVVATQQTNYILRLMPAAHGCPVKNFSIWVVLFYIIFSVS